MKAWPLVLLLLLLTGTANATNPDLTPPPNARLPLGLAFHDENGQSMTLRQALANHPAVLIFADWTCSALCGTTLGAAAAILPHTGLHAGTDYEFLVIGIDPRDGPQEAAAMKALHLADEPALRSASHFLSGDAATVRAATEALGFHAVYIKDQDQFSHPAALLFLAADGRLTGVMPTFSLDPDELRSALITRTPADGLTRRVLLICHAVLSQGAAGWVRHVLMAGGIATILALAGSVLALHRRQGRS